MVLEVDNGLSYHMDLLPFSLHKNLSRQASFDRQGVLLSRMPYGRDCCYHATSIASFALMNYRPDTDCSRFKAQIQWIMENIRSDGCIYHDFPIVYYENIPVPWAGALAQGLCMSALTRAYENTGDPGFLKAAENLFIGLKKHCTLMDGDNNLWFAEYPGVPSILNGMIYTLFGLYDLMTTTGNRFLRSQVTMLWTRGIHTVQQHLLDYDLDGWSRYDLVKRLPADLFYHRVHVDQLRVLFDHTRNPLFQGVACRWEQSLSDQWLRTRLLLWKQYRLFRSQGMAGRFDQFIRFWRWKHT